MSASPVLSVPCLPSFPSSELLGVLNPFLRCPPWCWMVCPPSRGSCLPLSPFLFPFVAWCVRLPDGFVSPCLPLFPRTPSCFRLLDGVSAFSGVLSPLVSLSLLVSLCWMVCPPSQGSCLPLSPHCLPSCFPLLDGASAFPRVLSPLVSPLSPFLFPFVGWCVRLPKGLVSPCLPIVSLLASLCWMVRPPSPESCLPLSPFLFPFLFPFVGWCQLPGGLVFPFLPLTPLLTLLVSLCWMVCPPSRGDKLTPLVSPCLPSWSPSGWGLLMLS